MAKARSPDYPAIGLKEAIEKVSAAYAKDYQNKVSRVVLAEHMGYKTLNGKSLGVLSAIGKFGLLEGRADDTQVSDLAVTIIAHPIGSVERIAAIKTAAGNPSLFAELDNRFQGGRVSDSAIRSWMLTQKFIPTAADTALRSYRETKQLVEAESGGYVEPEKKPETPQMTPNTHAMGLGKPSFTPPPPSKTGTLQEVFNLDEGPVTLTFPEYLSVASYQDLSDHLAIFLRKAKRRADEIKRHKEMTGDEDE
jgi:hypothetical protein